MYGIRLENASRPHAALPIHEKFNVYPAIKYTGKLRLGEKFNLGGQIWTVVDNGIALCDNSIANRILDERDTDVYEGSQLESFVNEWAVTNNLIKNNSYVVEPY